MRTREDFPVGTRLIAPALRPAIADFYRFARSADDVADDPEVGMAAKLDALDVHQAGLAGAPGGSPQGLALRATLSGMEIPDAARHAGDLLEAFRRDARGEGCATWDGLVGYCDVSAAPVGRFLLALHGEAAGLRSLSDPLCAALQVLNHLRDLGPDLRDLGRCYMPADWRAEAGSLDADLMAGHLSPAWRIVADRALDGCDALLDRSAALPAAIADGRLAAEAAATQGIARAISARLRAGDPLARRIRPSAWETTRAMASGAALWLGRARRQTGPLRA